MDVVIIPEIEQTGREMEFWSQDLHRTARTLLMMC